MEEEESSITSSMFITELGQQVKGLQKGLNCIAEKVDYVVDQLDRTLNDSRLLEDGQRSFPEQLSPNVETRHTQTPNWLDDNKEKGEGQENHQVKAKDRASKCQRAMRNKSLKEKDRDEHKKLIKLRLDALRDLYHTRILNLKMEWKRAPVREKPRYLERLGPLEAEFKAEKQKLKEEKIMLQKQRVIKATTMIETAVETTQEPEASEVEVAAEIEDKGPEAINVEDTTEGEVSIPEVREDEVNAKPEVKATTLAPELDEVSVETTTESEVESIPEEEEITVHGDTLSSISSLRTYQFEVTPREQNAAEFEHEQSKDGTDATLEEEESEIEEQIVQSKSNHNETNETDKSVNTTVDEDIASSFKPSASSLRSILSSVQNSASFGGDSKRERRSSASEALLKLRQMNVIPALPPRSPPEMKSPPKTPRSPLGLERFVTKFPQVTTSREASFSEDVQSVGEPELQQENQNRPSFVELLDDLPNTNHSMLLDLSQSPGVLTGKASFSWKVSQSESSQALDTLSKQRSLVQKYAHVLWDQYLEKGIDYDGSYPNWEEESTDEYTSNESGAIPENFLRQLCAEHLLKLVQTTHCSVISRQALKSELALTNALQQEILSYLVEPKKRVSLSTSGIKARAEKTSHILLEPNRLMLAKYVYDNLGVWPDSGLQTEVDLCLIGKLI